MPELLERNQVGKKADLADYITVADARATPLLSMIPKGTEPANTLMQWPVDNYPEPKFDGVLDNKDVTDFENAAENRAIVKNYVQIFERKPKVSRLAENVSDVAGVGKKKEMAKAVAKMIVAIKRDIESSFCSDRDCQAENGTDPYRNRGLGSWISNAAQSTEPVPANYRTPAGNLNNEAMATLTEKHIQDVMESIWTQTGQTKRFIGLCGSKFKRAITDMTCYQPGVSSNIAALRTYNADLSGKKIVATVDFISGDFGEIELLPSAFLARDQVSTTSTRRCYILDMEMLEVRWNQMPTFRPLENQGGGPRGLIEAICGLVVKNPLGLAKFYPTT